MLSVPEYCKRTGKHPETVREWCRLGIIKAKKLGKKARGQWTILEEPEK